MASNTKMALGSNQLYIFFCLKCAKKTVQTVFQNGKIINDIKDKTEIEINNKNLHDKFPS